MPRQVWAFEIAVTPVPARAPGLKHVERQLKNK